MKEKIRLFYLPGYSPEPDPDENVWNHVKNHTAGEMHVTGPDQPKRLVVSALHELARLPRITLGFSRRLICVLCKLTYESFRMCFSHLFHWRENLPGDTKKRFFLEESRSVSTSK